MVNLFKLILLGNDGYRFIDFLPYNIDKGTSIKYLVEFCFNSSLNKTFSFGDSMNDTELLKATGNSIIVKYRFLIIIGK